MRGFGSLAAAALVLAPGPALAHAFGARYDLPIPLWLWLSGAGLVVGLSFVVVAVFLRERPAADKAWRLELTAYPGFRLLAHPAFLAALRVLSVLVFVLIVVAGLTGSQSTTRNLAPVFVWVIWWVGFAYVAALAGNLWRLVNPWAILFQWAERWFGQEARALVRYPTWLGAWPAVGFFFAFVWLEVVSDAGEVPAKLSGLILGYALVTWAGMYVFGRDIWLARAEAFSVCFGMLSRFAITESAPGRESGRPALWLRPPAVGLLVERPVSASLVAFVILLLASVSFDGIAETPFWAGVLDQVGECRALEPLLVALHNAGFEYMKVIETAGLVTTWSLFVAVYVVFCRLTALAGGGGVGFGAIAGGFVTSLVPIAIAYHLAHYFSYLMLAGQLAIPLVSDPFGLGWNLFGTSGYVIDISVVSAKMVWYLATVAIVVGHVAAVYLGHVMALRLYPSAGAALRSQIPLLILMVAYSMLSLWILAQPVIDIG